MYKSSSQSEGKKEKGKEKTLQEKVKTFFGLNQTSKSSQQNRQWKSKTPEVSISSEIIFELSSENPTAVRLRAISQLNQTVHTKTLEDNALLGLVKNTTDLISSPNIEDRHAALLFYKLIIEGQFEKLTTIRGLFFTLLISLTEPEDLNLRMDLLKSLTKNGTNVVYFEYEIGPFLMEWTPTVFMTPRTQDMLALLINFIKYNAAYLEPHNISGIIESTCRLSARTKLKDDVKLCLDVLDAVLCYSSLPSDVLPYFVIAICRIVNIEKLSSNSWKVMRNFLGTSMGMSGVFIMCTLIQEKSYQADYAFLRGAVYFLGASLWGSKTQCVSSLGPLPTAILPSLKQALDCPNGFLAYEVVQCVLQLISCEKHELHEGVWEQILDIMLKLMGHAEVVSPKNSILTTCVHNVLSKIESMSREKSFRGSEKHLYMIIGRYSALRPDTSVLRLIDYLARTIDPIESDWIEQLNAIMEHYYKNESRTAIRVKTLDVLSEVFKSYRHIYEEKLIDQTVLQFLSNVELESDLVVCRNAVQLLVQVALNCHTIRCFDILDIIKKVLQHNFDHSRLTTTKDSLVPVNVLSEQEVAELAVAVTGLVEVFKHKLCFGYPKHAIHVYLILVNFLEDYYVNRVDIERTSLIRQAIFDFLLSLRANSSGLLGFVDRNGALQFSCNLMCTAKDPSNRPCASTGSPPVLSPTGPGGSSVVRCDLCINPVFQLFIKCLMDEHDWLTVKFVLEQLPGMLRNKSLTICAQGSLTKLCTTLTSLVMSKDSGVQINFYNTPARFSRTDFYAYIFPVLSTLAAYHSEMASHVHRVLIKCLEQGLKSKCLRTCITGLSLCTLEMQEAMYKLLPDVLLSLSKISATIPLSVPMLEFLSTLIRLPSLYISFVDDQYMSIFAIALPYTNSFKFNHYTVALAHHVIAMWFLKCRIPFRREFVRYILNGLKTNVVTPFEEKKSYSHLQTNLASAKQEGTPRERSGSLNDPAQRSEAWQQQHAAAFGPRFSLTPAHSSSDLLKPNIEVNMMNLHQELLETCHDLFSRYCFCTASTLPKRSYLTDFLLENANSSSWLVGHSLVTITTSGPGNKAYRDALCEQCYRTCVPLSTEEKAAEASFPSSSYWPSQGEGLRERKRHRSEIQHSTRDQSWVDPSSKDDLQMVQRNLDRFTTKSDVHGRSHPIHSSIPSTASSGNTNELSGADSDSKKGEGGTSLCSCWCPGWAEVLIRRPTGNISWLMRIQNSLFFSTSSPDFPVPDCGNWFKPNPPDSTKQGNTKENINPVAASNNEQTSLDSEVAQPSLIPSSKDETQECSTQPVDVSKPGCPDSYSPLRRTSSSPDMKGDWLTQNVHHTHSAPFSHSSVPPHSPPISKSEHFPIRSSPSSPTSKLTSELLESNAPPLDRSQKDIRGSVHGSPKKEDKQCKPIPEEHEPSSKGSNRTKLMLDLSGVDNQPSKGAQRSTSPPQSAGPILSGSGKIRHLSKSSFTKRGSVSPPPSSPKGNTQSPFSRDRVHTISVVSPSLQSRRSPTRSASFAARSMGTPQRDIYRVGLNPSFVFTQLYHMHLISGSERPLILPRNEAIDRAVNVLDHIPPYETHKIGVVYIGPHQAHNETAILSNRFGSLYYKEFIHGLGTFVRLKDVDPKFTYLGGLDQNGQDGEFACSWQDDIMQVIFHVATLMPNQENDPLCNNKKRHIGNDSVLIAYNCSGESYDMTTVKGQFIYVCIEITPGDHGSNVVTVKAKNELLDVLNPSEPQFVSDKSLPIYVRQLALHANLASVVSQRQMSNRSDPYVTNWLERLRQLKRIRERVLATKCKDEDSSTSDSSKLCEDFTSYV